MRRILGAVLVIASLGLAAVAVAADGLFIAPTPPAEVDDALVRLSQPSVPGPLPGSAPLGASQYLARRPCSKVVAAYRKPNAPLPEGAKATTAKEGVLTVEGPFGTSAIVTSPPPPGTPQGSCVYTIAAAPNFIVTGSSGGDVSAFASLGCDSTFTEFALMHEYRSGGRSWVAVINALEAPAKGFVGAIAEGTIQQLVNQGEAGLKPGKVRLELDETKRSGTARFADGARLSFTCTGSLAQIFAGLEQQG